MIKEWQVAYSLGEKWQAKTDSYDDIKQKSGKDRFIDHVSEELLNSTGMFHKIDDLYSRFQLLSQIQAVTPDDKDLAKEVYITTLLGKENKDAERPSVGYLTVLPSISFDHPNPFITPRYGKEDIENLPENSFFLYLPFTLSKPYISKDDHPFYIHENPVRKEWLLRTPYIPATSWKGYFRSAIRNFTQLSDDRPDIRRLLGNEKGEEVDFIKGRLTFFPTFFDKVGLEVINPHLRTTSAGENPIHIECVPIDSEGVFALLYMPLLWDEQSYQTLTWKEILQDIENITGAVYSMMTEYGFGAKTSDGMGRVKRDCQNADFLMKIRIQKPPMKEPPFPRPLPDFIPDTDDFCLDGKWQYFATNQDIARQNFSKNQRGKYKKQRKEYLEWVSQVQAWQEWDEKTRKNKNEIIDAIIDIPFSKIYTLKNMKTEITERIENE